MNIGPSGPTPSDGQKAAAKTALGFATDLSDLSSLDFTGGNYLRVLAGGAGVEQLTPAQVRADLDLVITRTAAQGSPDNGTAADATTAFGAGVGAGDTDAVAGVTYNWVDVLASPNDVLADADAGTSRDNLLAAINGGAGEGTLYGTGTVANPNVYAEINGGLGLRAIAIVAGTAGNSLTASTTRGDGWTAFSGGTGITPAFTGQRCIVGDAGKAKLEYTSLDGTTWTLTGPTNVQDAGDGINVITTEWTGDVPTYTSTPISTYLA